MEEVIDAGNDGNNDWRISEEEEEDDDIRKNDIELAEGSQQENKDDENDDDDDDDEDCEDDGNDKGLGPAGFSSGGQRIQKMLGEKFATMTARGK